MNPLEIAAREHQDRSENWDNLCLRFVRKCYGKYGNGADVVPAQAARAIDAWTLQGGAKGKYTHTLAKPPAAVPVFWAGPHGGAGHVALADGTGYVWSNDIVRQGYIDRVPMGRIKDKWNYTYLGWAETINGVRIWTPGPKHSVTVHTVKSGDTLTSIAAKYDLTIDELLKRNKIKDLDLIFVGENLKIK